MTTTATKTRPILFSGPMVRAILDGRKTQTRRVVKPQPEHGLRLYQTSRMAAALWGELVGLKSPTMCAASRIRCPYGAPGDVLWVRESWYYDLPPHTLPSDRPEGFDADSLYFRADGECCAQIPECQCAEVGKPKWKPSIHLPRWACRLWLRVKSVRVERVQEISAADVDAEGYPQGGTEPQCLQTMTEIRRSWYRDLWDSINAERGFGWAANPWVWVVEFERIEKPADAGGGEG